MNNSILLVDDEENILNSVCRVLADEELNIFRASSGEEALEIIGSEKIAVIVSDNLMPGMKGIELLSKVNNTAPDIVRILMTGNADLETAIAAINKGGVYRFIEKPWDDVNLIETIKDGIAQYNCVQALKQGDDSTFLSLAHTIELKDSYTRGHCDRVAKYALMIADELGVDDAMKTEIKYGCWLHDIGKIGVPEEILNKKGKLDKEEFEIIMKHPSQGSEIAKDARLSDVINNIILSHHERFGGNGYPAGIEAAAIPLEAKIAAVADVYDALTSDRSYRPRFNLEEALDMIEKMKGDNFDPEIADVFLSLHNKKVCS